jgi:formylglycine-generating enzyme
VRLASLIVAATLAGCSGTELSIDAEALADLDAREEPIELDAGEPSDLGPEPEDAIDAGAFDIGELDTGAEDAGASDAASLPDAPASSPDASASSPDASPGDSGWGACTVNGAPGDCVEVSTCTGDRVATPGHCPGPANIQCCTERGEMCDPSAIPRPNEGLFEAPGRSGCPRGMIAIESFCVDEFEAMLVEVRSDGSTISWSPFHHPGNRRVRALSVRGAIPQGYIDQVSAGRACAEAGKRLCTNSEWLRACRGPSGFVYPYGDTRQNGACNDARSVHPAVELFPNDPTPFDRIQDACINQLHDSLDPAGDHALCVTEEGAFDMMGNLHEWTSDPAGTFRGGFYVDTRRNGEGCLYVTTAHDVSHWDYSTGFRCCYD